MGDFNWILLKHVQEFDTNFAPNIYGFLEEQFFNKFFVKCPFANEKADYRF